MVILEKLKLKLLIEFHATRHDVNKLKKIQSDFVLSRLLKKKRERGRSDSSPLFSSNMAAYDQERENDAIREKVFDRAATLVH